MPIPQEPSAEDSSNDFLSRVAEHTLRRQDVDGLLALQRRARAEAQAIKLVNEKIAAEIERRFGAAMAAKMDAADKSSGTLADEIAPGVEAVSEITKKVSWDSDALLNLAMGMPQALAKATFKFDPSISEAKFNAATGVFRTALEKARTVKYGTMKVSLREKETRA